MKGKKLIFLSITLSVFVFLVACDPSEYEHNYENLMEHVTQVALIEYDNPAAKELFNQRNKVKPINVEKIVVVEILQEEQKSDFCKTFSESLFMKTWRHEDSPNGLCICLFFDNGNFELVSLEVEFSGIFDSEGNVVEFIGSGLLSKNFVDFFEALDKR